MQMAQTQQARQQRGMVQRQMLSIEAQVSRVADAQQETALILQRLTDKVQNLDEWRQQQEDDKRTREQRCWTHGEASPREAREWLTFGIAAIALLAALAPHFHWAPWLRVLLCTPHVRSSR